MTVQRKPAAFLSYARFDDVHEKGKLTQFREVLAGEVQFQTGQEFSIFQDRDILWGEEWKARIREAIDVVTFFIPVLTPNFFSSPECRDELATFFAREKQLCRSDLVLPVYYAACPVLSHPGDDEIAHLLASRNWADWRELRFRDFSDEAVRRGIAALAIRIGGALDGSQAARQNRVHGAAAQGSPWIGALGDPKSPNGRRLSNHADVNAFVRLNRSPNEEMLVQAFDALLRSVAVGVLRLPPMEISHELGESTVFRLMFSPSQRHQINHPVTLLFVLKPLSQVSAVARVFAAAGIADRVLDRDLPDGFQVIFDGAIDGAADTIKSFVQRAFSLGATAQISASPNWVMDGSEQP